MRPFSILLPTLLLSLSLACTLGIAGSGRAVDDSRVVSDFDAVEVSAGLVADVAPGPTSVVVHGDDNLVPHVVTRVRGRTLVVEPDASFDPAVPLVVTIRSPAVSSVTLRAGGAVSVHDIARSELALHCDAGGTLIASGTVDHLVATQSAGGDVDATGLVATSVSVDARAGGSMHLHVRDAASGAVLSGSEVSIHGRPRTRAITEASGGTVRWLEDAP